MAKYEVYLSRDDGTRLALLDNIESMEYTMVVHDVGACQVVLPGSFDRSLLAPDRRIEIWRQPEWSALTKPRPAMLLERTYLVRKLRDATDTEGRRTIGVIGYDGNYLLKGRIVAYDEGTAQAEMTDEADDMVKAVAQDNLGTDAATARQISSSYFSVQADLAAGPSITKSFHWQNVLSVCQDIAETARAAGTDIYWDMVPVSPTAWQLRTNTGQLGQDHTYPNGQKPVVLGLKYGNLAEPVLEEDWTDEANYIYVPDDAAEVEDTTRSGRSAFGRREAYADAAEEDGTNGMTSAANRALAEMRPRLRLSGRVIDSPQTRYGLHWRFGDQITVEYQGRQFNSVVRAVRVMVDGDGRETIEARVETTE